MRRTLAWLTCLQACSFASGCYTVAISTVHPVPKQQVPIRAALRLPPETRNYQYSIRSWTTGIANRWTVMVGDAVVKYSDAYMPALFQEGEDATVRIDVLGFQVQEFRAIADLRFTVGKDGDVWFSRVYNGQGQSRAGAAFWGGVFAMKAVISSSIHEAMRSIFDQFAADVRAGYKDWPPAR